MKQLSIVHTESSLGWGGQEIRVLSESQGLIRRGHDVKLLCPPEARIFSEAKNWDVPAIALPIAWKRPAGVTALYGWLKRNRCDLVSTHSSTDSWLSALALLALGRPVAMVRTRHISSRVPRNPPTRWLYTRATARIVTTGEALRQELVERNGYDASRIVSVPTGIDTERYCPGDRAAVRAKLGMALDRKIVGIVATLRSWKGHRFLIEALPENAHLVIVGDGPMRSTLEGMAGERVLFVGNKSDVVPWLQSFDVFALPSYANEGVPQALAQAMAAGLPCVTTHVGSIAELARPEETALVVPPGDAAALRSSLERLLADPVLARKLGDAARRHVAANFSRSRMLDRMEEIYRQLAR